MHLKPEDWNQVEMILARIEELDSAEGRLAFGKRILGDDPMRRSYFRGLVQTNGIETFATLWNAAIKNIDDGTITTNYFCELEKLSMRAIDKQWLQSIINLEEPEDLDAEPPPVAPAIPSPAAQPPANNPAAPIHHVHAGVNYGINALQVHIDGGVRIGPGQPAMEPSDGNPQPKPAVRFTIRQTSKITATTKIVKATLVREDSAARITRIEVDVKITVPMNSQTDQIADYFNPLSKLDVDDAHAAQELMKSLGKKLFEDCFTTHAASNELYPYRQSNRKLEFVVEGSPQFHSIPWELMRYVFTNNPISNPVVDQSPIFRHVVNPPDFQPLRPIGNSPLRILWISARLPHDLIARDAVLAPVRDALATGNVIIDEVLSGSFLEMKQKLNEHRDDPRYHVLHLDMHGEVMSPADLRSAFDADPNWVLDARDGGLGNLPRDGDTGFLVESTYVGFNQGTKSVPVSAHELSAALAFGGIPLVVLNACHSADVPSGDASMVAHLVQSGGYPAVGFQQPLTVTGAVLFFTSFYRSLTEAKTSMDIQQAVHAGREALRNQSNRGSRSIEDGHLPVSYTLPGVSHL